MGKLSGAGKMSWPGGELYHGEFRADREDGVGAFVTSDGNTFCGEFQEGKGNGRFHVKPAACHSRATPCLASRPCSPASLPP
jgi:hypothetical protein